MKNKQANRTPETDAIASRMARLKMDHVHTDITISGKGVSTKSRWKSPAAKMQYLTLSEKLHRLLWGK